MKAIYRQDGALGFYKGYFISLACFAPNSALWWFFYDTYSSKISMRLVIVECVISHHYIANWEATYCWANFKKIDYPHLKGIIRHSLDEITIYRFWWLLNTLQEKVTVNSHLIHLWGVTNKDSKLWIFSFVSKMQSQWFAAQPTNFLAHLYGCLLFQLSTRNFIYSVITNKKFYLYSCLLFQLSTRFYLFGCLLFQLSTRNFIYITVFFFNYQQIILFF